MHDVEAHALVKVRAMANAREDPRHISLDAFSGADPRTVGVRPERCVMARDTSISPEAYTRCIHALT
jgi:RNA-binding protein YhbY